MEAAAVFSYLVSVTSSVSEASLPRRFFIPPLLYPTASASSHSILDILLALFIISLHTIRRLLIFSAPPTLLSIHTHWQKKKTNQSRLLISVALGVSILIIHHPFISFPPPPPRIHSSLSSYSLARRKLIFSTPPHIHLSLCNNALFTAST